MQVTATEAKNRFGHYCAQAKSAPVVIEKDGRPDSVVISFEHYKQITQSAQQSSVKARKKEFESRYAQWLDAQNAEFEAHGIWCDGLVGWLQTDSLPTKRRA
jgi:prevent-host-death family protein